MNSPPSESPKGELLLPLETCAIARCLVDAAFSLQALDDDVVTLRIECPFKIIEHGCISTLDPGVPTTLGPAVALWNGTVKRARAAESGRLEIEFEDGRLLVVEPNDDFEAWELSGPRNAIVLCCVGGGLAVWEASS